MEVRSPASPVQLLFALCRRVYLARLLAHGSSRPVQQTRHPALCRRCQRPERSTPGRCDPGRGHEPSRNRPGHPGDPQERRIPNQFRLHQRPKLLGAPDAVPPEIQARVARLQNVLDTQPNTPETLPTRMKLQEMIDQLLVEVPREVSPGIVKPTRPFGMSERPIDLPGSTLDEQFRMEPPPPEMRAETLPEPRMTVSEEVDQANALKLKRMAEAARQRNQIGPVTPEALGIPDAPPQPELLDIGGTDNPPLGPPRAPEGFTPPTPEAPPQPKPAKLTDLVKQVDEQTLRGMLEPQQLDALAREYGLTPKQATAIILVGVTQGPPLPRRR